MSLDAAQMYADQRDRWIDPLKYLEEDVIAVYIVGQIEVGWPIGVAKLFESIARKGSVFILGTQFGDEGKGGVVDKKIEMLLQIPGIEMVYVYRHQGGANAGHTLEVDGIRVAVHHLPSSVMYPEQVAGIMDSGMIVHLEDLQTEIMDVESSFGDLNGKLILSQDAMLATDLDRAMEVLNVKLSNGKSDGGTKRGISAVVADKFTREGFKIRDILAPDWETEQGRKYDVYAAEFAAHGIDLAEVEVPDFRATREARKINKEAANINRKVGSKENFLRLLRDAVNWIVERDMIQNTFKLNRSIYTDLSNGIIVEASQAMGIHPDLGRFPDVTSTDTSIYGVLGGTKVLRPEEIEERIGIAKLTYMSSVGAEHMITDGGLLRTELSPDELAKLTYEQLHLNWIRTAANERGSTTRRFRDMCFLDLELMRYNCRMSGIEMLIGTHLDIAKEDEEILVCTHYEDANGEFVPYQPGVIYQQGLTPKYARLPGWDGVAASKAKSFAELPENAQRFLAFLQRTLGYPIVMVTNGPERSDLVQIDYYNEA